MKKEAPRELLVENMGWGKHGNRKNKSVRTKY